jgi:glycosyltransferase involved in cell wall biosynthesis
MDKKEIQAMDAQPTLSIVIPVFNEARTLRELVARVLAAPESKEIIIVNDCSTDESQESMEELVTEHKDVVAFTHEKNRGKGAAVRTGINACQGELVLIQDADLEYDPKDYPRLVEPILNGRADVVFGSRFVGGDSRRVLYFWHSVANRILTLVSNMVTNLNLSDMEVCYKVFRRDLVQSLKLRDEGFGIEPELTAKVARKRVRVFEVGISYSGRTYGEGKKIRLRDGFWALVCIIRYGLFRLN